MKRIISFILTISIVASCFLMAPVASAANVTFTDVNGHWAKDTIIELANKGIISGRGNGIYDPNGTVTRAEFMKLLVGALGDTDAKATIGKGTIADVKESDWFYQYVASGLANGVCDVATLDKGNFQPNAGMTRGNVAIWMVNGLGIYSDEACNFADVKNAAEKQAVATSAAEGLINGYEDGSYRPNNTLTRAEAAVIVKRVMTKQEELTTLRKSENKIDFAENVVELKGTSDKNVLKSLDEKTKQATFINCTDELKNLKAGDVVYVEPSAAYPDGAILKVGAIKVDGDTVVIDCVRPELQDVFDKIDIAKRVSVSEDDYIAGSAANGVSLVKQEDLVRNGAYVADVNSENLIAFVVSEHGSKNLGEFKKPFEIGSKGTGLVTVKADIVADILLDVGLKKPSFEATVKVESSAKAEITFEDKKSYEKTWPLGDFAVQIYGPLSANVEMELVFTAEGEYEVTATAYCEVDAGIKVKNTKVTQIKEVRHGVTLEANAKGEMRIGPQVVVGLGAKIPFFDPINVVDVEANVGIGIEAETAIEHKLEGTNGNLGYTAHNTVADKDGNVHICDICVDGSVFVFLNGNAGVSRDVTDLLKCKELRIDFGEKTWTITDWYCSIVGKSAEGKFQFGLGTCPNLFKQIKISKQPEDVKVSLGEPIKLTVEATTGEEKAAQAIAYKWYKDGEEIKGATSATLSISAAKAEDAGTYKAVAYYSALTESALSAESKEATVVVSAFDQGPKFISQPQNVTVEEGYAAILNAEAEMPKGAVVEYQWYKDGKAISGAKSASYSIVSASKNDAGVYHCEAWISGFENLKSTSNKATVTVTEKQESKPDGGVIDTDIFDNDNKNTTPDEGNKNNSSSGGVLDTDIF